MAIQYSDIFSIQSDADFASVAMNVFDFQKENCLVYSEYLKLLGRSNPKTIDEIPFLPISFFKTQQVIAQNEFAEVVFKSSGTGGVRSQHWVASTEMYRQSFLRSYELFIGNPEEQVILALLPNYLEQGESSLVFMVDELIRQTKSPLSGFFLSDFEKIVKRYEQALSEGKKVVLFGVAYSLLDFCTISPNLSQATIIETGGMKGRRKELTKKELHDTLKKGLNCPNISSEYGMTELLSQGYSIENGIFQTPPWMKVSLRQVNDPFSVVNQKKTGGINVIDLANLYSCSFIETQDLGKIHPNGFEIIGRFDTSDLRGCNLLVG